MKKRSFYLLGLSFFLLFACHTPSPSLSSNEESSSLTPLSESSPSSSSTDQSGFTIRLEKESMEAGSDFLSICKPSYYYDGTLLKESDISKTQVLLGEKKFAASAILLEEGTYTFKARYNLDYAYASFTVTSANVVMASEGKGYNTISKESSEVTSLSHFPYAGSLGVGKTPSKGTVNLLVVPASFSGGKVWKNEQLSALEKAFKGEAEETGWESLKSYYTKSSYGELTLNPVLASPYVFSTTEDDAQKGFLNNSSSYVTSLIKDVVPSIITSLGYSSNDFDTNGDGYIDAVEFVYLTSKKTTTYYTSDGSKIWWNFTTYDTSSSANLKTPVLRRYCWMNASSIFNGYYETDIDSHVVTHEFGHMLGLNDYYDYDGSAAPMGLSDMMDLNIGDHNAYSKYLLGWVGPKVLDYSYSNLEITLNDFASTGDCLLIPTSGSSFNNTPYAEYLMLSYYTPTGVNEQDASGYKEWQYYGTGAANAYSGLQVIHVDERLYDRVGSKENSITGDYTDLIYNYVSNPLERTGVKVSDGTLINDYAYQLTDNTPSRSGYIEDNALKLNAPYHEAKVIPASGEDIFVGSSSSSYKKLGSRDVLYGTKDYGCRYDEFTPTLMENLFPNGRAFNDGNPIGLSFKITSQTDSSITLRLALR